MHNNNKITIGGLKKMFGKNIHCEPRKQTREACRKYCMKEETRFAPPEEFGVWDETGVYKCDCMLYKW